MSIYFTELAVILLLIFILFGPNLILEIIKSPVKGVRKPNKAINKPSKKVVKEKKDNNNHSNEE